MKQVRGVTYGLALAALAASCGGQEDPADAPQPDEATRRARARAANRQLDQQLGLLLRVELDADHSFTFFEPSPGSILTLEEGVEGAGSRPISDELAGLSLSEMYRRLRPGAEVPEALLEAEARARHAAVPGGLDGTLTVAGGAPLGSHALGGGVARGAQALTGAQFLAQGGCPNGDLDFCLTYWTGGAYAYAYSHYARFNVSPRLGDVFFELRQGPSFIGSWDCTSNGFYSWTWHLGHTRDCWFVPWPPFEDCETTNDHANLYGRVGSISGTQSEVFHFGGLFNH